MILIINLKVISTYFDRWYSASCRYEVKKYLALKSIISNLLGDERWLKLSYMDSKTGSLVSFECDNEENYFNTSWL